MKGLKVIIVSGMSGAGKTVALNVLEDKDYFVVDNIPFLVASRFLESAKEGELAGKKLALGMDIRSFKNIEDFKKVIKKLKEYQITCKVFFLEASNNVILNRYNLSRRKHPLLESTLLRSIEKERELMSEVKEHADFIIDTSYITPVALKRMIEDATNENEEEEIIIHLQSFGFKYGVPRDLDLMFDVRFLPNPYYNKELRVKTGNDKEVRDFVMDSDISKEYYKKLEDMLEFLIPNFIKEGKNHLSIGIGCSGGKHRSVTFTNYLYEKFKGNKKLKVIKYNREEERGHWD